MIPLRSALLPDLAGVHVEPVDSLGGQVQIRARPRQTARRTPLLRTVLEAIGVPWPAGLASPADSVSR